MSSFDSNPDPTFPPTPKEGMSGGCKVLLIVGIILGVVLIICCGGIVTTGWYFARSMSDDPEKVRAVTEQMVDMDIPESLIPAMSIDFKAPFSGRRLFAYVVYVDQDSQNVLILASIDKSVPDEQWQQLEIQIKNSLSEEGFDIETDLEDLETWERELEVRGQKVKFEFATGKDTQTGKRVLSAVGRFAGKEGVVFLMFVGDAEQYDEERIVSLIESIR